MILSPLILLAVLAPAQNLSPGLLVSGYTDAAIHVFHPITGAPISKLPGMSGAQSMRYAPDGSLLVCLEVLNQVVRFDGVTGAPLGPLVINDPLTPADETGGLNGPTAAVIGPDGALYVASFNSDNVLRYDGVTGLFLGVFIAAGTAGLNGPDAGMSFGPDNNLYVPSFFTNRVLRFNGATGAFIDNWILATEGGVSRPRMLRWRSDGRLFLTSWANGRIHTYDLDGAFVAQFATSGTPVGLVFTPGAGAGDVLVSSDNLHNVVKFDGQTGAGLGALVPAGSDGLTGATWVEYFPDPELHLRRKGGTAANVVKLDVMNAQPNGTLLFLAGFVNGSLVAGPCTDALVGITDLPVIVPFPVDGAGRANFTIAIPAAYAGQRVLMQAFEVATCRPSELIVAHP